MFAGEKLDPRYAIAPEWWVLPQAAIVYWSDHYKGPAAITLLNYSMWTVNETDVFYSNQQSYYIRLSILWNMC